MDFYISKNILGTPNSLVIFDQGDYAWDNSPDLDISLGDLSALLPIEELIKLLGVDAPDMTIGSEAQLSCFKILGIEEKDIVWPNVMPPESFLERIVEIKKEAQEIICAYTQTDYDKTYRKCREFLRSLERCSVDIKKIHDNIRECKSGPSVQSSLRSFLPKDESDLAAPVYYTQTGTSTGRLTVKSGPSILTLPAKNRDILKSSKGGKIFQVDFVSLEPRVMLYTNNKPAPDDIYTEIKERLFNNQIERKVVKLATLSALYGSSYHMISEITGNREASKNVLRRVRQYFDVDHLERGLMQILREEKQIANYYGRPLIIDDPRGNILVSHYIQSTAVDTALLGFHKLMKDLTQLDISPTYVIHDAVVVDVPMNKIKQFKDICSQGVDLPLGHFKFDVTQLCSGE